MNIAEVPITVTIGTVTVVIREYTLEVDDTLAERSTGKFSVIDQSGVMEFTRGQLVEIHGSDGGLWSGYVDSDSGVRAGSQTETLLHSLVCIDQQYLADKRIAARSYDPGVSAGDVVRDLHTQILSEEGVTLGLVEEGTTFDSGVVINYQPVSAAIDQMVESSSGYVWGIDQDKVLTFHHRSSKIAPWIVTGADILNSPAPTVDRGNPDYRDTEYVLGGMDTTDVQNETRIGDGEIQAFPLSFPLATKPIITLNGVSQVVGIKGLDEESGYDWGWNKGDPIISQASEAVKLTVNDHLDITYQGQFSIVAKVVAPVQISGTKAVEGGTGIVDHATVDKSISSRADAFAAAANALKTFGVVARKVTFATIRPGLSSGQMATVDLPPIGLYSAQMLIQSVELTQLGPETVGWAVTAVDGPVTVPWTKVLGGQLGASTPDLVSVGDGSVLALLTIVEEETTWSELTGDTIRMCDLFPLTFPAVLC